MADNNPFPMHVGIVVTSATQLAAVYALLGGASPAVIARAAPVAELEPVEEPRPFSGAESASTAEPGTRAGERDAAGTLFDPARHTGTTVKSGLWRMKTGVARGPGEGEDAIPSAQGAAGSESTIGAAGNSAAGASASSAASASVEEDDEFAAFAAAAGASSAAEVPARKWTDADLSKLTNQAAKALGGPDKVREVIAKHVPTGETPHSRNIPVDKREAFAVEVEEVAGIKYAG